MIVCFDKKLNGRAGGPAGYLFNLREGLNKYKNFDELEEIEFIDRQEYLYKTRTNTKKKMKNYIIKVPYIYEQYLIRRYKDYINTPFDISSSENICHVHTPLDFMRVKKMEKNYKIIFTPHSPEASYIEVLASLRSSNKKYDFRKLEKFLKSIDIETFKQADYLIFPSKEAMEPYYETLPEFKEIIKDKKIYFMMTGTKALKYDKDKQQIRKQYNIPHDAFVISYVGRHNWVKGFSNLVEFSKELLNISKDIYILTAGTGDIKPLDDERWIDVGWTSDPGAIINASDIFILPNNRTYFDLILLEVISLGKPVLASKTGGNITVANYTDGVHLYDKSSVNDFLSHVEDVYNNRELLNYMGECNLKAYNNQFKIDNFAERYINVIREIIKDINSSK